MKIVSECLVCFAQQAQKNIKKFVKDPQEQIQILKEVFNQVHRFPNDMVPIELSPGVYHYLSQRLGIKDLYAEEKKLTNQKALELKPFLIKTIQKASNPLYTALKLSIIGNILDYTMEGVSELDLKKTILDFLEIPIEIDHIQNFENELQNSKSLLLLTDNSGEAVFDLVLLDYLKHAFPGLKITIGGKKSPILNDMTSKELIELGFSDYGQVVSTGSDLPGNMEKYFSDEFCSIYDSSPLILSKGQGNYEGLSESKRNIFFALMAKCPCISNEIGVKPKALLFMKSHSCFNSSIIL